ncbi:Capreomycidine synthase [Alphaproteobacteria bacterium SO-S41]|nr:Capreomycidine synthase [Alphaproteobacteria bacterium SO-S41]
MKYVRMPIEVESPEERGYSTIRYNLAESSVTDRTLGEFNLDLSGAVLAYGDHRGFPALRHEIAEDVGVGEGDVLVTAGAAGALFIIATTLLGPDDHLVVVRPNYATNLETPRAIGCAIDIVDLTFEDSFGLDVERLRAALRPNTRLISLTTPHNPTGVCLDRATLDAAVAVAAEAGCPLLVDETYRDMIYGEKLPLAATLGAHVISVSSVSKSYGIPGVRVGWIVNRDPVLMERFLAAKEQIGICGGLIDEMVAAAAVAARHDWLPALNQRLSAARDAVEAWLKGQDAIEWVKPEGGCVCFPRIKPHLDVDLDLFYRLLDEEYGVAVGPGHWFEMDRRFMRIGFGWPTFDELTRGLEGISAALRRALR